MPFWFPFALLGSFIVMMASGSKVGFKTPAELAAEEAERKKRQAAAGGPLPYQIQGGMPWLRAAKWPYKGLPFRVGHGGKLFQRTMPFPNVPEPHAVYAEVGGGQKIVVLGNGRMLVKPA